MKMLGLNPLEQEIIDLTNEIAKNGFIYFPEFCQVVLKRFREEDEEVFRQNMFKILCGTEPFPDNRRAKKYKLHANFFTKKDFLQMMLNLPVEVQIYKADILMSQAHGMQLYLPHSLILSLTYSLPKKYILNFGSGILNFSE